MQCVKGSWWGIDSLEVVTDLLRVSIVPSLGGRIMNYQLGAHRFLWTDPLLHGVSPPPARLADDGGWLNWGGDKVWLAPQGWETETQWPGPPDAVLDGGEYRAEVLTATSALTRVRLTSEPDARSGMRLSRTLDVQEGSSRLRVVATMTNVSSRVRRWGIWPVTQIDAASRSGDGWNAKLRACIPLNLASVHPLGYRVMYGSENHPQYAAEGGTIEVRYRHQVGKIGVDADAGWVATIDGESGNVLVQQAAFAPGAKYPDDASVEVWTNGHGTLTAYGRTETMPQDVESNPYMLECELVSPFAQLSPGESFDFAYTWAAANIGKDEAGSRRIRSCTAAGCEVEAFQLTNTGAMSGRFGVFFVGECRVEFVDEDGLPVGAPCRIATVSPLHPLVLTGTLSLPEKARAAVLAVYGKDAGKRIGELSSVPL